MTVITEREERRMNFSLFREDFDRSQGITIATVVLEPTTSIDADETCKICYTEQDVEEIRAAALALTRSEMEFTVRRAIGAIDAALDGAHSAAMQSAEASVVAACEVMFDAFCALLPSIRQKFDRSEALALLRNVLDGLRGPLLVKVTVSEDLMAQVMEISATDRSETSSNLTVVEDTSFEAGSLSIEWAGGSIQRNVDGCVESLKRSLKL